jgi:hypothetical protein
VRYERWTRIICQNSDKLAELESRCLSGVRGLGGELLWDQLLERLRLVAVLYTAKRIMIRNSPPGMSLSVCVCMSLCYLFCAVSIGGEEAERMTQTAGRRHRLCTPSCAQQFRVRRADRTFCFMCCQVSFYDSDLSAPFKPRYVRFQVILFNFLCHIRIFGCRVIEVGQAWHRL